jgi:hypothetical protein
MQTKALKRLVSQRLPKRPAAQLPGRRSPSAPSIGRFDPPDADAGAIYRCRDASKRRSCQSTAMGAGGMSIL